MVKPKHGIRYEGFLSPSPGKATQHEKTILSHVYSHSREAGMSKERSSRIAWSAVKKYRGR